MTWDAYWIVVAGLGYDDHGYVLIDGTQDAAEGSLNWGRKASELYHRERADIVVAEANFGGDMVRSNIRVADKTVPVQMVHASRGKEVRAQPVASLYSDGLVHHVGYFPELELELTGWVPGDPDSPNRLDALVWVITWLMIGIEPEDVDPTNWKRARIG